MGYIEGPGEVSPSGSHMDQGDDGETCGRRGVRISPGGGGIRRHGTTNHT